MIKPWNHLTPYRRGWAVGSIFGLVTTTIYLVLYGSLRSQIPDFSLIFSIMPTLPGIIAAEFMSHWTFYIFPQNPQFIYALTLSVINYFFWGALIALCYHSSRRMKSLSERMSLFSLLCFFCGITGMAFCLGRGVNFRMLTLDLGLLALCLCLTILSLMMLYWFLLDQQE